MTLTTADLKVIKTAFEDYAAANTAVVSAMSTDTLSETLTRAEERTADRLLSLMRRYLPLMGATCERALAVDDALVKVRETPPPEFMQGCCRRAWRSGVDKTLEVIQSKLRS